MSKKLHKFRAVQGSLPRMSELYDWDERKTLAFLNWASSFLTEDRSRFVFTKETIENAEKKLDGPTCPEQEFLYRINLFTTDLDATPRKFFYKFNTFLRNVLNYLKQNPAYLTDEMKVIMESTPRMSWALSHFKTTETKTGQEVTVRDTQDLTQIKRQTVKQDTPEVRMLEGMYHVANIFEELARSIKPKDIKNMNVKDKISAISKLAFMFKVQQNFKPNANVFQQFNIYKAEKDDLEKAILEYAEEKE